VGQALANAVYQFEVWQGDDLQASGEAALLEDMRREAVRYAVQYGQDGPIDVREFVRYPLTAPQPPQQDKQREPLSEKEIDEIFDRNQGAPTLSFRYIVTRDIEAALGITQHPTKEQP
jgi:hypothetical protein